MAPRLVAAGFATAFLALHLPYLPSSLEDVDSINFALGIRDFDVAEHQPHPPGYPLFILAAKALNAAVRSETQTLGLLAVVAGALSAFALIALFGALDRDHRSGAAATVATLLTMTAPLFWITAARPLTDVPGLAAVLFVQWLTVTSTGPRALMAAAFAAGLAAGIRSQVVWLTLPLLALTVARHRPADRWRMAAATLGSYLTGLLVWGPPLMILSGGPGEYWRALAFQGGQDLAGVEMLSTTPTLRQLVAVIEAGFFAPWALPSVALIVLGLAAVGIVRLWLKAPRTVVTLVVAFGPYIAFNMLFQEPATTRYALPQVVPVAYLAVHGACALAPHLGVWLAAGIAGVNLPLSQHTLAEYSRTEAPAFRMIADMRDEHRRRPAELPALAMHRRQALDLRRPFHWIGNALPFAATLPSPPQVEWLELVKYWNGGGRAAIWFVADPLRSDLALVHHDAPRRSYRWSLRFQHLFGGVRPNVMDWYELRAPAWYLGEGWALTPETAGVANAAGKGPGRGAIEGWIQRTSGPATVMVGGRNLAGAGPSARIRVAIDGRMIDEANAAPGFFLRMTRLAAGSLAGAGDYARVTVSADSPHVAVEQFDAQAAGRVLFGFGDGWHEGEYSPATGRRWRWMSDRALIRLRAEGHALSMRLRGESEAENDSHVVIRVGDRIVAEQTIGRTLALSVKIPAAAVAQDETIIAIETDGSYVPAERYSGSQDRRRLGLKIFECEIKPAS